MGRPSGAAHAMRAWSRSGWRDHCLAVRDRLLASRRFQRWAATFPLTRPIARRRTRQLFDLCAGFVYSQVLLACVRLRLFGLLAAEGPQTAAALATRMAAPVETTRLLLQAAASLRLVEARSDGRFGLGVLGAALLGNPGVAALIDHHPLFYSDLRDPVALLRGHREPTNLGDYWDYTAAKAHSALSADRVAAYSALMSASLPLIADEILAAYRLDRHRCLLDVGGGDGTFATIAGARAPSLRLILFDLPPVAALAERRFTLAGIAKRATAIGGDFLSEPLPTGADIIALIRVIHDHDDVSAMGILRAAARALPPDGVLLLAEPMSETPGAEPISDAYFALYLLARGGGKPRTPVEIERLLRAAGFGCVETIRNPLPLLTRVMVARRVGGGTVNKT
jgi:demethylspheroidene O-methyltransferase